MDRLMTRLMVGAFAALIASEAAAVNVTPYYLFDGDAQRAAIIQGGVVTGSFSTFSIGYPPAITSTIWLGDRDDRFAREFTLAGVPTGATSVGGNAFSQLLDGTTDGTSNFGIECCGSPNSVTVANSNWTNQQVLFNTPGNLHGLGIAFDTSTDHLFATFFDGTLREFDLTGAQLNSVAIGGTVAGLAYEQLTDTLWGWDRSTSTLEQYSTAGVLLSSTPVSLANTGIGNPFGGEMPISAAVTVPEPTSLALLGSALLGFAFLRGRRSA